MVVNRHTEEPLEVNILSIWPNEEPLPILLVSLDLLYPGTLVRDFIEQAAKPLPSERVFVAASHTHRAPMSDPTKPKLGKIDSGYLSEFLGRVSEAIARALDASLARPGSLHISEGRGFHSINRRKLRKLVFGSRLRRNVILRAPNKAGSTDESLLLLSILGEGGDPIAHVWNYACHPVAHPSPQHNSSHYIHHVREALRNNQNAKDVPVLFFQGFSGDTRPNASVGIDSWQSLILRLLNGPRFRNAMTTKKYQDWCSSLAGTVLELYSQQVKIDGEPFTSQRIERVGSSFVEDMTTTVKFHRLSIGKTLDIVGISGEVVSHYARETRAMSSAKYVMCVGCIDDTFGYIPTQIMIQQGGYESQDYCVEFGLKQVCPGIEDEMNSTLRELLKHPSKRTAR